MANTIAAIHTASRQTYGVRRIHAELRHGQGRRVSRKRVWRCMKLIGLKGVHRRRWRRPKPAAASWPDLVQRKFRAEGPDRLWVTDITQHRTGEGWVCSPAGWWAGRSPIICAPNSSPTPSTNT